MAAFIGGFPFSEVSMFGFFWVLFKITGLAPWKTTKRGALLYNWWFIFTGYGLLLGAIAQYTYAHVNDLQQAQVRDNWKNSATARVVSYIDFGTTCIAGFTCLAATTIQTKNIVAIIGKFDDLKSHHRIPKNPFRFRHAIFVGMVMTSLLAYDLASGGLAVCQQFVGAWYLRFFLFGSEFIFTSSVLTLYDLFQYLNNQLRSNSQSQSTDARHAHQVLPFVDSIKGYSQIEHRQLHLCTGPPESLREQSAIHWHLSTIGKEINSAFNGQLLSLFVTITVRVVTVPYFVFLMVDSRKPVATEAIVANVGWIVVHVLQLCLLVWPCSLASDEAKETSTIIVHNLNKPLPADIRNQMEMFLVQLTNHKLNFNVYDLFTIDLTVITSVAGAVTTYLVILIQFQNSSQAHTS